MPLVIVLYGLSLVGRACVATKACMDFCDEEGGCVFARVAIHPIGSRRNSGLLQEFYSWFGVFILGLFKHILTKSNCLQLLCSIRSHPFKVMAEPHLHYKN